MKNKKQLLKDLDGLFNNIPLDTNVTEIRTRLMNFVNTEIVDYESAPESDEQSKFILIEF
jgi:hypothetical protein